MRLLTPLTLAAISLALTGASVANATSLHYTFSPDSYFAPYGSEVQTPVTGAFDFDTITGLLSNVDYTSSFGHYTVGSEYDPGIDTQIFFGTFGTSHYDVFQLASGLGAGKTVKIYSGTNPTIVIAAGGSLTLGATSAVPEPATWAMMFVGFGIMGVAMRYRRRETKTAYA